MDINDSPFTWMEQALKEAQTALHQQEVPVGAVVVYRGQIVGRGYNRPVAAKDPSAHAEIVALREAGQALGNYRLSECDLYVTLEPCPMCVGAIVHGRIRRVFYGADDPKAGACGGAFAWANEPRFNHHTRFTGGIHADECGELLRSFFKARRSAEQRRPVVRTPDDAFASIPGFAYRPRYVANLLGMEHVRIHRVDEGPQRAPIVFLCLHGSPGWSYSFHSMLPVWLAAGHRAIAVDLIGFGRSDKWEAVEAYRFSEQHDMLCRLIERLDLSNVVVVGHGLGAWLAWTLPMQLPERFYGMLLANPQSLEVSEEPIVQPLLSAQVQTALNLPHPSAPFRAALQAFAPGGPAWDEAALLSQADAWVQREWTGPVMSVAGLQDLQGCAALQKMRALVRGPNHHLDCPETYNPVFESGELIAQKALDYFV